jgi:hypothetical protein
MRLKPESKCHTSQEYGWSQDPFPWVDEDAATSTYSDRLEKLIEGCREIDPEKRPKLQHLRSFVEEALVDFQKRYPGIESTAEDDIPEWWRTAVPGDEFVVGTDVLEAVARKKRRFGSFYLHLSRCRKKRSPAK